MGAGGTEWDTQYACRGTGGPDRLGKSAIATALARDTQTTVLVATLGLLDQYEREYSFFGLRGRQEYPCADPDKLARWRRAFKLKPTAFDCHVSPMWQCEYAYHCPYLIAKHAAEKAPKLVVTYRYGILSRMVQERKGLLVLDECHNSAEEVLAFGTFQLSQGRRARWRLPRFPFTHRGTMTPRDQDKLEGWLESGEGQLEGAMKGMEEDSRERAQAQRLHDTLTRVREGLGATDFFLEIGASVDGLRLRPLDAKPIAHRLWKDKDGLLMMSATIGDPKPLASELGLDEPAFRTTPHLIPVDKRPVFDLGFERMTHKNLQKWPALYSAQARVIANWIKTLPPEWRGLIVTSSVYKVQRLREHLGPLLGDRLWESEQTSLRGRVKEFIGDPRKGVIAVETVQGWGSGLDLRGEIARFLVFAGTPFPVPTDAYEIARAKRPGGRMYQRWISYSQVPQACGRITRAIRDADGEYYLKACALADGSATTRTAMRYYPEWFKKAIEKV